LSIGSEIYRKAEIASMWKISERVSATNLPPEGIVKQVPKEVQQAKTPQLKFKVARQTTLEISTLLSECGDLQFKERHQVLSDLFTLWGSGHEVVITPKLSTFQINFHAHFTLKRHLFCKEVLFQMQALLSILQISVYFTL